MITLNSYFARIFCINCDHRTDRWRHVQQQCAQHGIVLERWPGRYLKGDGNRGCTESHGALLRHIGHGLDLPPEARVLILEDDFEIREQLVRWSRRPDGGDFQETVPMDFGALFDQGVRELPGEWFMLYLGGHYAEAPRRRVSPHVIEINHMKTTSSYAVTAASARVMAPSIGGIGPIDELYRHFHLTFPCYIFQPRLMVQYNNFSDLQQRDCNNAPCMEDPHHENLV